MELFLDILTTNIEDIEDLNILNKLGIEYLEYKQYPEAKKCFKKAVSKGDGCAAYNLGLMYYIGKGVKKNPKKAIKYFELASNRNYNYATYNLGIIYYNGENGIARDFEKVKYYFEKLPRNNEFNEANYNLGRIYINNNDFNKAIKYLKLAAEQGNIKALGELGTTYEKGPDEIKNLDKARRYYKLGVQKNDEKSIVNLGNYYYKNERNTELAKYYFEMSKTAKARHSLGVIYFKEENYSKAKEYFELAAQDNDSNSLFVLYLIYLNGLGVERNFETSLDYLIMAANLGNQEAINILDVYQRMGVETNILKEQSKNIYI